MKRVAIVFQETSEVSLADGEKRWREVVGEDK